MSSKLEIVKVNRHDAGWDPKSLFQGFTVRATLTHASDMITRITEMGRLRKRLTREVGEEGEEWFLSQDKDGGYDLYLKSTAKLIMWKLQDHERFKELFERVEQHKDDLDEVREDSEPSVSE